MAEPFALDLAIPSDVRYVEGIVAQVRARCEGHDFPRRTLTVNLPIALSEAIANAILRGNGERRDRLVRIRARLDAEALVVEITDEGDGFDLERCTLDPTTPDRIEEEDGRGLFLMRHLVDRVEQFIDGGNVVRLTVLRS
jgi:serine/threonine-protein kinase RsbW